MKNIIIVHRSLYRHTFQKSLVFYRKMSSMKDAGIKVCCTSGKPIEDATSTKNYVPLGKVISTRLPDLQAYLTVPVNKVSTSLPGIVLAYDIFGFDIVNTRRFADMLADKASARVIMPDFFRGKPWPRENFPPPDKNEFMHWIQTAGSWEIVSKDLCAAREALRDAGSLTDQSPMGIIGFCWGGKQVMRACTEQTRASLGLHFGAGVSVHGAFLGPEDAELVSVPMLFMPASDDPDITPIKEVLDSKPFGRECVYHTFTEETHGFAAARGDWDNNSRTRDNAFHAVDMAAHFFRKQLLSVD